MLPTGIATVAYLGATILFILCLGGLSNPETSRRGNLYGIIGMTIAVVATVLGPRVSAAGISWIIGAMVVGGAVGLTAATDSQRISSAGRSAAEGIPDRSGAICTSAPIAMIDDTALVTLISGVCSAGFTFHTTM